MWLRTLEGYTSVEGDHAAKIRTIQKQLARLGTDDGISTSESNAQSDDLSSHSPEPETRLVAEHATSSAHKRRRRTSSLGRPEPVKFQRVDHGLSIRETE